MEAHDLDRAGTATRDWVRALLWIGLIAAAITVGWLLLVGAGCGCTTAPAA